MPRYEFERDGESRTFVTCPMAEISALTANMETLGWVRIYDHQKAIIGLTWTEEVERQTALADDPYAE